ncbi:reductase [Stachybotrys elegans]|uniref:Reductase n=1 Tax=Stachybotrys elegans TaxID=80388 RepID=A0A8K0SR01_9HYPO|nr:reductase [Stachybotrys elegans]
MRVLVLGGTKFVGRLCASEAVSRGHQVTVFNRGSRPAVDGVTTLVGDRLEPKDLAQLDTLSFDVVIDTWHGDPDAVKRALQTLRARIHHYIYISSVSVYRKHDEHGATVGSVTEDVPLLDLDAAPTQYARNKVAGEMNVVRSGVPSALLRAGVILGPGECQGQRLPTWLRRMDKGGPTLAPGPRDMGLQFIDVRDLASFVIDVAEKRLTGPCNVASASGHTTWGDFLDTANRTVGDAARLCWLEPDKVAAAKLEPWTELPLWLPPDKSAGFYSADVTKAMAQGLRIRPASETIQDTWAWMKSAAAEEDTGTLLGLDPDKEAKILEEHFADVL